MHHLTLSDVLDEHRRTYPDKTAVVCGEHRYTYSQLEDRVSRLSQVLRGAGIEQGTGSCGWDRIAIDCSN